MSAEILSFPRQPAQATRRPFDPVAASWAEAAYHSTTEAYLNANQEFLNARERLMIAADLVRQAEQRWRETRPAAGGGDHAA